MNKPKRPILPIMVDIETLSLDRHCAIIDIAVAPIGEFGQGTRWLINPESYQKYSQFEQDSETVAFHTNNKSGLIQDATQVGVSWHTAAQELYDQLYAYTTQYEIHMWSQGKDFDFPCLEFLLKQAGLKTPWKYSHTHCLRDLSAQYPEVKRSWYGNHTAMQDVRAQIAHIQKIAASSDRAYGFVFGFQEN